MMWCRVKKIKGMYIFRHILNTWKVRLSRRYHIQCFKEARSIQTVWKIDGRYTALYNFWNKMVEEKTREAGGSAPTENSNHIALEIVTNTTAADTVQNKNCMVIRFSEFNINIHTCKFRKGH